MVLQLSGVTLRAAIFPFYVFQIQAAQRYSDYLVVVVDTLVCGALIFSYWVGVYRLMQARPDFSKLHSAFKYARTFMVGIIVGRIRCCYRLIDLIWGTLLFSLGRTTRDTLTPSYLDNKVSMRS